MQVTSKWQTHSPQLSVETLRSGALGYIRNRKTEGKIIQNRKTAKPQKNSA